MESVVKGGMVSADACDRLAGEVTTTSSMSPTADRSSSVTRCGDSAIAEVQPRWSKAEDAGARLCRSGGEPSSSSRQTAHGDECLEVDVNTTNRCRGLTGAQPTVGVGIAALVVRNKSVIIGRRKGSHGAGTYALPGGHLDFGETWEACAIREVKEETGLDIINARFAWVTNCVMLDEPKPSHYITLFMCAELRNAEDEPANLEPDKCEGWQWVVWPFIPYPRFAPLQTLLDSPFSLL